MWVQVRSSSSGQGSAFKRKKKKKGRVLGGVHHPRNNNGNGSLRESGKEHLGAEGTVLDTSFVLTIKNCEHSGREVQKGGGYMYTYG